MDKNSLTKDLLTLVKSRNAKGFIIDYTNPSIASALAILCATHTLKDVFVLTSITSSEALEVDSSVNLIEMAQDESGATLNQDDLEVTFDIVRRAYNNNLLIIQSYDIVEYSLLRPWKTRFCLMADLLPFKNSFRSDIVREYSKVTYLQSNANKKLLEIESRKYYSDQVKISFDELEWAYRLNKNHSYNGIITEDKDPVSHKMWGIFTIRQKQIVSFLHQQHKSTNSKIK